MSDYEVGFGKPPQHSQFKPGQSGNSKGRPKGSRNVKTDLHDELNEKIVVREGGKPKRLTKQRALIKTMVNKGLNGNGPIGKGIIEFAERYSEQNPADPPEEADMSEEDQQILKLFIARIGGREG